MSDSTFGAASEFDVVYGSNGTLDVISPGFRIALKSWI